MIPCEYRSRAQTALARVDLTQVDLIIQRLLRARDSRSRIFVIGNGGSAANASHFACDLGKLPPGLPRFDIRALCDVSVLTALANDFAYQRVFAEPLINQGRPGDVLIALSTSGRSPNIREALREARTLQMDTILFTGATQSICVDYADRVVCVPETHTGIIEDVHMALLHMIAYSL